MTGIIKKQLLFSIIIISFILLISCGGEEPNPCTSTEPVTAKFTMGVRIVNDLVDSLIVTDTVLTFNRVTFSADEFYSSYEWTIGNDPRVFTDKSVTLFFEEPENNIEIKLIAQKAPNLNCFPEDDGIDTLVQKLTVIHKLDNPIYGDFEGYLEENPTDIFIVSIVNDEVIGPTLINLNNGCDPRVLGFFGPDFHASYKIISFVDGTYRPDIMCLGPEGWFFVAENNHDILIDFTIKNESNPSIVTSHRFIGKRIN